MGRGLKLSDWAHGALPTRIRMLPLVNWDARNPGGGFLVRCAQLLVAETKNTGIAQSHDSSAPLTSRRLTYYFAPLPECTASREVQ